MNIPAAQAASGDSTAALELPSRSVAAEVQGSRSPSGGEPSPRTTDVTVPFASENAPVTSPTPEFTTEFGEHIVPASETDTVTPNDPLLAAGERTAREIVDNAINGIFCPAAVAGSNSS